MTPEPICAGRLLAEARSRLATAAFRPPPREAALLLARVLGLSEAQTIAYPERAVEPAAADRFRRLVRRRLRGEPVAYLVGVREFYGRPFRVDRRVLIPRPETEFLIEACLGLDLPPGAAVLDIGTGSGCVATTLALELPEARVTAIDLSPAALAVAAANARALGARLRLAASDLAASLRLGGFDLVTANPPYVDPDDAPSLSPEVTAWEPPDALFAASGGRAVIARLLSELVTMGAGGHLVIEIGFGQSEAVQRLAGDSPFELREIVPDYAGIPRTAILRRTDRVS